MSREQQRQWLQLTAGRGTAECAWVVPQVLRRLIESAEVRGIKVEVLESHPGPFAHTLSSVLLAIEGEVAEFAAQWTGTIQWIGRSPFRPTYKRKNWYVGVELLAPPERPGWSERDVTVETMRASGPGG